MPCARAAAHRRWTTGGNHLRQRRASFPWTGFLAVTLLVTGSPSARSDDGAIVAWGYNHYGQCDVPAPNAGFTAVAGGEWHSLGLREDGSIVAWGANHESGVGFGQCDVPAPDTGFVAVSAGIAHSLGLRADGSIVAWGDNSSGQCSVPSPNTGFTAIAAGYAHSLGLKTDGSIVGWGYNLYGQCNVPSPNSGFVAIAGGGLHSLGLRADGSIAAWGSNLQCQCSVPAPNAGFVAVAAGGIHSVGLKADSSTVGWGSLCGWPGPECHAPEPNTGFVAIAAGEAYTVGRKSDGSLVTWGDGIDSAPEPDTGFVAVAAGRHHCLAVSGPGPQPCWSYLLSYADFLGIDRSVTGPRQVRLGLYSRSSGTATLAPYESPSSACWRIPQQEISLSDEGCQEVEVNISFDSDPASCGDFIQPLPFVLDAPGGSAEATHYAVADYPLLGLDDPGVPEWGGLASLLEAYAPVLKFHEGEKYLPVRIEVALHGAALHPGGPDVPGGPLPAFADTALTPDDLARYSWSFMTLDLPCSAWEPDGCQVAYETALSAVTDPYVVYATAIRDLGKDAIPSADDLIVLQYWMHYYFNDNETQWCGFPFLHVRQTHEEDWEHVTVGLTPSLEAIQIAFGGHGMTTVPWNDAEKFEGTSHPVVYVSRGGHANYSYPASDCLKTSWGRFREYHEGNGSVFVPQDVEGSQQHYAIEILPRWAYLDQDDPNRWIEFSGYWGNGFLYHSAAEEGGRFVCSSQVWRGPAFREEWANPCGELFKTLHVQAGSPVDLVVHDPWDRTVGPDGVTIPMARYEVFTIDSTDVELHRSPHATVPFPLAGEYRVEVLPLSGSAEADTFSLWVTRQWLGAPPETTMLAEDVPLADIPPEGYRFVPDVPHEGSSTLVPAEWSSDWEPEDLTPIEWHLQSPDGAFDVNDLVAESLRLNGIVMPLLPVSQQGGTLIVRFPRGPAVHSIDDPNPGRDLRVILTGVFADSVLRLESPALVRIVTNAQVETPPRSESDFLVEVRPGSAMRDGADLRIRLPRRGHLEITIVDVSGRRVRELTDAVFDQGTHQVLWDGRSTAGLQVATGVYFVRAIFEGRTQTPRVLIVH